MDYILSTSVVTKVDDESTSRDAYTYM